MNTPDGIEIIARAVIVSDGRVLLVRRKGAGNTFLPGGHVDFGESGVRAIARELDEELGLTVAAGPFLAVVEHAFTTPKGITQEVNLLFTVEAGDLDPRGPVPSCEDHLEFIWVDCTAAQLKSVNLQPWVLQQALVDYRATGRMAPFLTTIGR